MAITPTKSKPAARKPAAPKPAAVTPAKLVQKPTQTTPSPKMASVPDASGAQPDLKKKELIDMVVQRSNIKKKDAKPVVEAMLAVLGETLASGRELNLQPMGKMRINRVIDKPNGRVIICKLRQSLVGAGAPKDVLADSSD